MAWKEASQGKNPLKLLFIFYRIFPNKSTCPAKKSGMRAKGGDFIEHKQP